MTSSYMMEYLNRGIGTLGRDDPVLSQILAQEYRRQCEYLSLVASSGGTDPSVLAVLGSPIINVTAEGYPGQRFHAGCRYVDQAEQLAIDRAKKAFGARFANVQAHCASFANHAVMQAVLQPGATILGMALDQGGHLTHGAPVNLSGRLFKVHSYGVDRRGFIDYEQLSELAHAHRPRMIICGTTSYTRIIDFGRVRAIADAVGAYVLADITHIAGLVVAGLHPNPIDVAHFTTTCTFKQLYGPRGGLIMMGAEADTLGDDGKRTLSQKIQSAVFPLLQGAPEVHTIAAKARALGRVLQPEFVELMQRVRTNANALAAALSTRGYEVVGGGSDNHIVMFRVPEGLSGAIAERALEDCNIVVNRNKVPGDARGAAVGTGVRLGTNTVSLRGMGPVQMERSAALIDEVLSHVRPRSETTFDGVDAVQERVISNVSELCRSFPLPWESTPPMQPRWLEALEMERSVAGVNHA